MGLLDASRRGLLRATMAALACALVYGLHAYAIPAVLGHSYFELRTIKVACDSRTVAPQELALRAGLTKGTTIWEVDTERAESALSKPSWVREAKVARRFPAQVSLKVFRRSPVAATFTAEGGAFFIDADGVVFREGEEEGYPDLPYLTGWLDAVKQGERMARLRTLMALLEGAVERGYTISQVDVDDRGVYRLFPETPRIAVSFGTKPDVEGGLRRMDTVLSALSGSHGAIRELDLAFDERVVVKAARGGLPELLMAKAGHADFGENPPAGLAAARKTDPVAPGPDMIEAGEAVAEQGSHRG